jgi:hypothetical protein
VTVLIICLVVALLFYALYRHRYVRFGMRILGATFFLEATDHQAEPKNTVDLGRVLPTARLDSEPEGGSPGCAPRPKTD